MRLGSLTTRQWERLIGRLGRSIKSDKLSYNLDLAKTLEKFSIRYSIALSLRMLPEIAEKIVLSATRSYRGNDRRILKICLDAKLAETLRNPSKWKDLLPMLKHTYKLDSASLAFWGTSDDLSHMPAAIAKAICKEASDYPLAIVESAQSLLTRAAGSKAKAPGTIARSDAWFALP